MVSQRKAGFKSGKLLWCRPGIIIFAALQLLLLLLLLSVAAYFFNSSPRWMDLAWRKPRIDPPPSRREALCSLLPVQAEVSFDAFTAPPWLSRNLSLPRNPLSSELQKRNLFPPRNRDLFPQLPSDYLIFVLYVHNRPHYLRIVVDTLSKVEGIQEALLIVSHDGFFEEMNAIVEGIRFCQVKQIYAPYSPHLFPDSFPGVAPGDCKGQDDPGLQKCTGKADQYGNHRAPHIVSLKHHWWWMMNTVWDGLEETHGYSDHMVFIEEDHYIFPNAYRNMQVLSALKACKCPECYAANLAPAEVRSRGEASQFLVAEKIGNVGYAFNRTVWRKIHANAREFCRFDEYNWDITMWAAVYAEWGDLIYTLRGPRASAAHFGKCGLHQGKHKGDETCLDKGDGLPSLDEEDRVPNIKLDWEVRRYPINGYKKGFRGWGGWGDSRDHRLCLDFASMYHKASVK